MAACGCHSDWPVGGGHTAVVTDVGGLFTFGAGTEGQCGHGAREHRLRPQRVAAATGDAAVANGEEPTWGDESVLMAACGAYHTACCTDAGNVWTWGRARALGLGDGNDRLVPTLVEGLRGVRVAMVSCGARHSAAVCEQGGLFMWGSDEHGQIGIGGGVGTMVRPVLLGPMLDRYLAREDPPDGGIPGRGLGHRKVALVACGGFHTLAVDRQGALWAWGLGKSGQLGLGDRENRSSPARVDVDFGSAGPGMAFAGTSHSGAVTHSGNCFMWGLGEDGRLGTGDESMCLLPARIQIGECGGGGGGGGGGSGCSGVGEGGDCVEMAAAGSRHTVAVSRRGRVWVWGYGADGQLGLPWVGRRTQKCLLLPSLLDQVST